LHEGGKDRLYEDPLRLAVFHLHRLRRRRHHPLCLVELAGSAWFGARGIRSHQGEFRRMNLTSPFSLCIVTITGLALMALPVGHSMIAGSILYLLLSGLDMGTAAEQFLNGMYSNYTILAVPLFILAA